MTKGVDEKIDEGVLGWFGHVKRMENDRIAKSFYVGEFAGSRSVGKPRKRWIDTVKDCLKERGLDVRQARRMAGICEREFMGRHSGDESLTLPRCHGCELSQLYEALKGGSPFVVNCTI